jgi:hypothetical protein
MVHVLDLDPFVTARALLPLETKYIAKASLFSVPLGGWALGNEHRRRCTQHNHTYTHNTYTHTCLVPALIWFTHTDDDDDGDDGV